MALLTLLAVLTELIGASGGLPRGRHYHRPPGAVLRIGDVAGHQFEAHPRLQRSRDAAVHPFVLKLQPHRLNGALGEGRSKFEQGALEVEVQWPVGGGPMGAGIFESVGVAVAVVVFG